MIKNKIISFDLSEIIELDSPEEIRRRISGFGGDPNKIAEYLRQQGTPVAKVVLLRKISDPAFLEEAIRGLEMKSLADYRAMIQSKYGRLSVVELDKRAIAYSIDNRVLAREWILKLHAFERVAAEEGFLACGPGACCNVLLSTAILSFTNAGSIFGFSSCGLVILQRMFFYLRIPRYMDRDERGDKIISQCSSVGPKRVQIGSPISIDDGRTATSSPTVKIFYKENYGDARLVRLQAKLDGEFKEIEKLRRSS
ncbi:hypothetical protein A2276_04125 [candidate division WOR-1 bacterium RIFOXYA12_FULL_43_27]|uniref:Uncharacterized protein n=1 Tax=candidate division WOR-1 bacterium RIFOXYC2_FULL_46_14 TaxID=1802587 RepID=A0A1F4U8U9_UNCSA|nr:MAG: hypothetical protein A2276_04125 [candidate division WOR-1 bacterium RIFOXYA12_FULL_43_27]OGC19123.1 MAG: hypothetical protein A2292_00210 [candidate division WOR-1 bacterium RIFOXYB2_FULL_46_45]OGC30111.1 MAG: hypothetical protein A2232_00210 [candidate division WOR-1 bacterium RIFOXYA2_FULL_46_56]OGC40713.1 MAG: hypothetical protein A2438_00215 [candidate division WOR-1 bacterium RIFOXYC2_FULL_46_14]